MDFGIAYAKAQFGARQRLPANGSVFISVKDSHKEAVLPVAAQFKKLGFDIVATSGTSNFLSSKGIENRIINKVSSGRPHVVDAVKNGEIDLVINTGTGNDAKRDGYHIRRAAIKFQLSYTTTIAGALAICRGITALKHKKLSVKTLQEYHNDSGD